LGYHVGEKALILNLLPKIRLTKKTFPTSFPNHLQKNVRVEFAFHYASLLSHKMAKRDTIGVIRKASAKLPHHKGLALTYLMENEMSFVCHVVEW
jgi:hypothetical protein